MFPDPLLTFFGNGPAIYVTTLFEERTLPDGSMFISPETWNAYRALLTTTGAASPGMRLFGLPVHISADVPVGEVRFEDRGDA